MIPAFEPNGNLPPGIHPARWDEIVTRYATNTRRRELTDGLLDALRSLKHAGCRTAYLDYFQSDRDTGDPKGIVAIDLGALP